MYALQVRNFPRFPVPVDLGFVIIRHNYFGRTIDLELRNHQSYHTLEDNLKKTPLVSGAYNSLEGSLLLRISLFRRALSVMWFHLVWVDLGCSPHSLVSYHLFG